MRVAIAIIVKDEAADVLPWVCWYFNLKADTIILYDDNSTDGTFELVKDVCAVRDVRLHRVPPSIDFYTLRQQQCYIRTIAEYGEEFDWIGFFDADEYLALPEGQDLSSFLDRPEDVGAVAVNWCNYGSSGYVLKPRMPPFYAYNSHYSKGEAINRHVKTFVRPKHWVREWHNPHFFDVHPLRYDNPVGQPVAWDVVRGITRNEADWDGAKIMHYQCRSMEHFVERIRKRPDIPAHPSLWAAYDHGEVEDNAPKRQYGNVARIMHSVIRASIARVILSCCDEHRPVGLRPAARPNFGWSLVQPAIPPPDVRHGSVEIRAVRTHFSTNLAVSPYSPRVVDAAGTGAPPADRAVCAVVLSDLPEMIFLFAFRDRHDPLLVEEDPRVCDVLAYECVPLDETGPIGLRQPSTRLFLSCEPPGATGGLSASRHLVNEWEKFTLVDFDPDGRTIANDPRVELIRAFASGDRNLTAFLRVHVDTRLEVLCSIYPALAVIAGKSEQEKARLLCGAAARYIF